MGVIGLDHGHIFGMCNGIIEAGAELAGVYDPDPAKVANFQKTFPDARAVASEAAILKDPSIHLIASAAVPSDRCGLGLRMMDHAKDYFTDKPPFTMLDQIASARKKVAETNRKYAVYYSERLHVEAAVFTETLIADGAIGGQVNFPSPDDDWIRGYTQEMEDFVDAVLFDREPVSGIELARDVVETIYAAYLSAEQGRWIELQ